MQIDDRAPMPPSEEELRVERVTAEILARFEAALTTRLPFRDDRARVPELGREARPAVASLHFALSVEVEGDESSLEHHEGLAMIHLLGRRAAVLGISPFSAAQIVDALVDALVSGMGAGSTEPPRTFPMRLRELLGATLIEGFVRGREEVVAERARKTSAASLPSFRFAPDCYALVLAGDLDAEAIEARGNELAREVFAAQARAVVLEVSKLVAPDRSHAAAIAETTASARVVGVPVHLAGASPELREMLRDLGFLPEQLHDGFESAARAASRLAGFELRERGGLRRLFGR